MKKCPFCAEEIRSEAIQCHFCRGYVTTGLVTGQSKSDAQPVPELVPRQKKYTTPAGKSKTEATCKHTTVSEKTVTLPEKPLNTVKKKNGRILIIAIIVFGILLLVIQFNKQLGIKGFP